MEIILAIFGSVLLLLCFFTLLLVLVQKPRGDGGIGAALGGGSMEAALGVESSNVLNKTTIYSIIGFFILTFALYLGNLATKQAIEAEDSKGLLSEVVETGAGEATPAAVPTSGAALQESLPEIDAQSTGQEAPEIAEEQGATDATQAAETPVEE